MKYGKLVRDRVLERIKAQGDPCTWHTAASDAEYGEKLGQKLIEGVDEFARERTYGELADVLEVLEAVILFHRFDRSVLSDGYASARMFTDEEFEDKDLEYDLIMDLGDLATAFVARLTPESLVELIRRVWEVTAFQGMHPADVEKVRRFKREAYGAFEKRIILDES